MPKAEQLKLQITGTQLDVPTLLQAKGRGCGGQVVFVLRPEDGHAVLLHSVGKNAHIWSCTSGRAPQAPSSPVDHAVAAAMVRRVKAVAAQKQARPAWRGDWKGTLICDNGVPAVVLERKVGPYVAVKVVGGGGKPGWTAEVVRTERWFSPKDAKIVEAATLAKVIAMALDQAEILTSSACVVRDTRRRAELDPTYAAAHPPRAQKPRKDTVEGWLSGQKIVDPDKLPALEPPSCPTSTSSIASATKTEAEALKATMGSIWAKTETSDLMQRAGHLIQRAKALVASPVCTGALKEEAQFAVGTAVKAWREARAAETREAAAAPLKKVAAEIAKAADRVARSCVAKGRPVQASVRQPPRKVVPTVARMTEAALDAAAKRDVRSGKTRVPGAVAEAVGKPKAKPKQLQRGSSAGAAPRRSLEDIVAGGLEAAARRMGIA